MLISVARLVVSSKCASLLPMIRILAFTMLLFSLLSCQTPPTRIKENLTVGPNPDHSRILTNKTVILDVRPFFAFTSGHIPNAQHVRWDFYGQAGNPAVLRKDLSAIARELSRLGVSPDTHVVVVGLGKGGNGEEGRVAWMLNYLGVKNVAFARENFFVVKRITGEATPNKNVDIWNPAIDDTLLVNKNELAKEMSSGNQDCSVVDVREVDDYLGKNPGAPKRPDIGAVNVPWGQFIDDHGLPNRALGSQLASIGIGKDKRVVLISEEGVTSALATQVLRELGYKKAGNFSGGYKEMYRETKK